MDSKEALEFGMFITLSVAVLSFLLLAILVVRALWSKRYRSGCSSYSMEELEKDLRSGDDNHGIR